MNYKLHYEKLIQRGKNRKLDCYKEVHHILPRCLGGENDKNNLVELTAREHFIAHILLVKIYPNEYGLIKAVNMMCTSSNNQDRIHNRMYGWLKEKFSIEMSRSQIGDKNSQHGTMWIHNLDLKESKKLSKSEEIPLGWLKGRKINWNKPKVKIDKIFNRRVNTIKKNMIERIYKDKLLKYNLISKKILAEYQYILFRKIGFESYKNVVSYNKSYENLIMGFKRNAKNYVSLDHKAAKSR